MAGGVEDAHPRVQPTHGARHLRPLSIGEYVVQQDEVHRARLRRRDRAPHAVRHHHLAAGAGEDPLGDPAHARVVVDDEDVPSLHGRRADPRLRRRGLLGRGAYGWEEDLEARSVRRRVGDRRDPSPPLDDRTNRREPEPGAATARLGGEERLEHVWQDARTDARPIVLDHQRDGGPFSAEQRSPEADRDPTAVTDGVAGVDHEVAHELLELPGVGVDEQRLTREPQREVHVLAYDTPQHGHEVRDHHLEIDVARLVRRGPAEQEELADEARRALGRALDVGELLRTGARVGELGRGGEDDRQQVVEVVGHAAREQPERLEALRGRQLRLERPLRRHVEGDARRAARSAVAFQDRRREQLEGQRPPVIVASLEGNAQQGFSPVHATDRLVEHAGLFDRRAVRAEAEHVACDRVPGADPSVEVDRVDGDRRGLDDGVQPSVCALQLLLGFDLGVDVERDHEARGLSAEADRVADDVDPERAPVPGLVTREARPVDRDLGSDGGGRAEGAALGGRAQVERRELQHLLTRPPVPSTGGVVHRDEAPVRALDPHREWRVLEHHRVEAGHPRGSRRLAEGHDPVSTRVDEIRRAERRRLTEPIRRATAGRDDAAFTVDQHARSRRPLDEGPQSQRDHTHPPGLRPTVRSS